MGTAAAEDAEEIVFEDLGVLALLFGAAFEAAEDDWGDLREDACGVFAGEPVLAAELVFHGAAVVTVEVVEESHGVSWLEGVGEDDWHKWRMVRAESWGGKRAGDVTGGRVECVHGGQNERQLSDLGGGLCDRLVFVWDGADAGGRDADGGGFVS